MPPHLPNTQLSLITWHFLLKRVWNITLGRNSKMIKKGVEPESIIILIKSLSSSLIPPISKYHCSMLVPGFEIQIVQLPLKFIFNNPPLHQQKSNKTNSAPSELQWQTFTVNTPTGNFRVWGVSWSVGKIQHNVLRAHDLLIEDTNA